MTKLTPADIANRADNISGSIDDCRRALAELALEAKEKGPEEWADIIANRPRIRRSVRTIRDYAVTAEFCRAIGGTVWVNGQPKIVWLFDLPYSFYSRAASMIDRLNVETIIEELKIAAESDTKYEMFSLTLNDAAEIENPKKPIEPTLQDALLAVASALTDLSGRKDLPETIMPLVKVAVTAMSTALSALERAKVE